MLTVAFTRDTDVLTPRDPSGMTPVGTLPRRTAVGVECATADRDGTEYLKIANEPRNYYVPENKFRITIVTVEGLDDCYPHVVPPSK
ncbi:hypothetical protein [Streptomyces sp. DT2A-34]|uniref:hypothetical protein n=1 Tax=unclassified Streptomyces TaxID=2593676 RepID=UPI00265BCD81|nr:hypothetical protein [Streptomyces sp. DT2A-34]MDO0917824.1 hypothetical protein [Streptomyces sp. DT2A-34]